MKEASTAYKNAIINTAKARATKAMIEFCIVESAGEHTSECSPYYGYVEQIFDEKNEKTNWATCEPGRLRLDGSFSAPNYSEDFKYGYISQAMSDISGNTDITLDISFSEAKTSKGITICFQEPVKEFTVTVGETIYAYINNKNLQVHVPHEASYSSVTLHITKLEPYRRVRISQIFLGTVMSYEDEKVINASVINEISIDNTQLPADTASFVLMNDDQEFDMLNPEGLYQYLKENQPVNVYIGVRCAGNYEYLRIGRYYINSWSTKGMKATFKAYTAVFKMDSEEYRFGQIRYRTLYEMIDELLDDVGIEHEIDPSLNLITVSGYIPLVSKREAFRQLIQTGCCTATSDGTGKIFVRPRLQEPEQLGIYAAIDGNNMKEWPEMKQKMNYSSAEVTLNTFEEDVQETVLFEGTVSTISGVKHGDKYKVWVPYKKAPAKDISCTGATEYELYACGAYVYIANDTTLSIRGHEVEIKQKAYNVKKYSYDNPVKVSNNLIITEAVADKIARYVLAELDLTAKVNYTGFPFLEAGDPTKWETKYGNKKIFLTKMFLEYKGTLSGKAEGAGKYG